MKIGLCCVLILFQITCAPLEHRTDQTPSRISLEDEIAYLVILGKFFDGDPNNNFSVKKYPRPQYGIGYMGGDVAGLTQKLDHLKDLGITMFRTYPVTKNDDKPINKQPPNGYLNKDYFKMDDNMGNMDQLKRLVQETHKRGMKILLDMSISLTGHEFPFYVDKEKRKSWYLEGKMPFGLPMLNYENGEVLNYFVEACAFWVKEAGIDGVRLDSTQYSSPERWRIFSDKLRKSCPREIIIWAEVAFGKGPKEQIAIHLKPPYINDAGFDTAYDFYALEAVTKTLARGESVKYLWEAFRHDKNYNQPRNLLLMLSPYDLVTFPSQCKDHPQERYRLAVQLMMTLPRIPLLMIGDEIVQDCPEVNDLFNKLPERKEWLDMVKSWIALRKCEAALRRGEYWAVRVEDPIFAFVREYKSERVLVIANCGAKTETVAIGDEELTCKSLKDLRSGESLTSKNTFVNVPMEPFSVRVLKSQELK